MVNELIGKLLRGKYLIRGSLGDGGHGEVLLADDQTLPRKVAIKRLRSPDFSPQINARFKLEAEILSQFNHPNIIPIYEMFEDEGRLYLVMEYCAEGSLKTYLANNAPLPLEDVVELGKSVARALSVAHGKGIIHRDVKPGNILLSQNGEGLTIKLTDFGIAHWSQQQAQLTQTGDVVGTPLYLAPEQIKGRVDNKTDVYALGVLLYGLLAKRHYLSLDGDAYENSRRILEEMPRPLIEVRPDVPRWLNDLIMQALSKGVRERPSAYQFYARLQTQGATDRLVEQTPKIKNEPPALMFRHTWWQKGAIAVLTWIVVAVVLLMGYQAYRTGSEPLLPAVPYQPPITEAVLTTTVRSESGAVNVRLAPSLTAGVVGQLADGTAVTLQTRDESGAWVYLSAGEMAGWMYADYLLPVDGWGELPTVAQPETAIEERDSEETAVVVPEPTVMPAIAEVATPVVVGNTSPAEGLRLRRGPSLDEPVLDVLPDGTQVTLLTVSDDGAWARVATAVGDGWVYAAYLYDVAP